MIFHFNMSQVSPFVGTTPTVVLALQKESTAQTVGPIKKKDKLMSLLFPFIILRILY